MVCIYCGNKTQVTNSRAQKRLNQIWRRRECVSCHAVFTTEEAVDYSGSIVVRPSPTPVATPKPASRHSGSGTSSGTARTGSAASNSPKHAPTQPFSRDKLFASILRAVGHRECPIEDAGALTATIIAKLLLQTGSAAISPSAIVLTATETLEHFDTAAAVQYGAYHRG